MHLKTTYRPLGQPHDPASLVPTPIIGTICWSLAAIPLIINNLHNHARCCCRGRGPKTSLPPPEPWARPVRYVSKLLTKLNGAPLPSLRTLLNSCPSNCNGSTNETFLYGLGFILFFSVSSSYRRTARAGIQWNPFFGGITGGPETSPDELLPRALRHRAVLHHCEV